jgi:ABC-type uncharacterized transport system substrate-binding protein
MRFVPVLLMCYGASQPDLLRRGATYVHKIPSARSPRISRSKADNLELVINLKKAQALGLSFPQSIRFHADEFIE